MLVRPESRALPDCPALLATFRASGRGFWGMRVRLTVPKEHVDESTLNPALHASAAVAKKQIESGRVPPLADAIDDGLRWAPEPAGQGFEGFDNPEDCIDRGWGDCDDLAPWWAAELWHSGVDPDAMPIVYQSGPKRWHAVVQRGDGSIDDPSKWAGMGKPGSPLPTTRPLTTSGAHAVAVKNVLNGAKVRLDVPLIGFGKHIGLALEQVGEGAFDALSRGANGAIGLLGFWGGADFTVTMMHAITHILSGRSEEEFYAIHGCTYGDCGPFVSGLAERVDAMCVGAMHANFDANTAKDIATTIIDPFGLHNLVAPLASDFVKSYATGLSHKGDDDDAPKKKKKKSSDDDTTSGEADACQSGWHWETRGGISVCVPNRVDGSIGKAHRIGAAPARGGSSRGGSSSRSGGSSRGGSSRSQSSRSQSSQSTNPDTGLPIYYNQMDYEGGDPFASQMSEYGMPPGYAPQQYAYGGPPPPMFVPQFPAPSYGVQPPQYPYANPYGATLPMTDLAPDAWGGYATPTAFSQYIDKYEQGIKHSAFDDAPLLGQTWTED
jgi:hypothetical protein